MIFQESGDYYNIFGEKQWRDIVKDFLYNLETYVVTKRIGKSIFINTRDKYNISKYLLRMDKIND